jgi:hypothetical protein
VQGLLPGGGGANEVAAVAGVQELLQINAALAGMLNAEQAVPGSGAFAWQANVLVGGQQQQRGPGTSSSSAAAELPPGRLGRQIASAVAAILAREAQRQQQQQGALVNPASTNVDNSIVNAQPLQARYAGMRLGVPLQLDDCWMTVNPGRQGKLTGSFQPLQDVDWTAQAYGNAAQ